MHFYATETEDGLIHVQNYVMGMKGQHKVHTKKGFEKWLKIAKVDRKDVKMTKRTCDCGLKASEVKEYDGRTWKSGDF